MTKMHYCFATGTRREGDDCRDCRGAVSCEKLYVLVVGIDGRHPLAYGPFHTRTAAEHAAMDYYGTAVTGASARDAFLITELRSNVPLEGAWK